MKAELRTIFDFTVDLWELKSYEDPKILEALGHAMREAYAQGYKAGGEDAYDSEFDTWHKLDDAYHIHTTDPVYSKYYAGCADPSDYKYKEQRKLFGFDDTELWDLDLAIAKFILPRLKRFIECTKSYPTPMYSSLEEYQKDLNEIVWYLESVVLGDEDEDKQDSARVEHAKDLIRNLLFTLWW